MKFIKATNNLRAVFGFLIITFSAASGLAQAKTEIPQKLSTVKTEQFSITTSVAQALAAERPEPAHNCLILTQFDFLRSRNDQNNGEYLCGAAVLRGLSGSRKITDSINSKDN